MRRVFPFMLYEFNRSLLSPDASIFFRRKSIHLKPNAINSLIAVITLVTITSCASDDDQVKPQHKALVEAVYASGFVVSEEEYDVMAQTEGYLSQKLVEEGSQVRKGDPLFVIESGQQHARYDIAKETYRLALRNLRDDSPVLRELAAALENAKSKLRFDSINHVRYINLLSKNATSQSEYDRAKLQYESARNDYTLQRSRYRRTKDQLTTELEHARNQLTIASDESGRYTLRSDIEGTVYLTTKNEGELVRRNDRLAVVGKSDGHYLQLSVDELDVQRVKKDQKVVVSIDAYPEKIFNAVITRVYPMVDRQQQSVRADARLTEPLPGTFSGLALEANIIIRQKENALVIPKNHLLPGDSVLVKTASGSKKIKITTGIETMDEVEVLDGLDTGTVLITQK